MAIRRSRFPAGFGALWGCVLLDLIGFGIVLPILPLWAERFGARPGTIGALVATYSAFQLVCAPLWGRLSDRVGRKPVLVLSLVGTAAGSLLTGLASSMVLLFVGRAIDGMSGGSVAVAQAAVADVAEPSERPRLLGLIGAAFGLGFVAGPALGALAALGGPRAPFLVAAGLAACNAVVAVARLPETHPYGAQGGARVAAGASPLAESAVAAGGGSSAAAGCLHLAGGVQRLRGDLLAVRGATARPAAGLHRSGVRRHRPGGGGGQRRAGRADRPPPGRAGRATGRPGARRRRACAAGGDPVVGRARPGAAGPVRRAGPGDPDPGVVGGRGRPGRAARGRARPAAGRRWAGEGGRPAGRRPGLPAPGGSGPIHCRSRARCPMRATGPKTGARPARQATLASCSRPLTTKPS